MEENDKDSGAGTISCELTPKSAAAEPWNEVTLREPVKSPFEKASSTVAIGEKTSSSSESVEKVLRKSKAKRNSVLVAPEKSDSDETAKLFLVDALSTDTIPDNMMPPNTTIEEAPNVPVRQLTLEDLLL
uniref:Uncharacterized protein n=1 Tax=Romanomermis culicivorax TaxID=13658 RepID=A0A915I0C6_ROMCU